MEADVSIFRLVFVGVLGSVLPRIQSMNQQNNSKWLYLIPPKQKFSFLFKNFVVCCLNICGIGCCQFYNIQMSEKAQNMKETFVLFQQLSMDFIPSDTKPARKNSDDPHELHLQFAIYYTVRTLLLEFRQALKYSGYKCIEMGDKQLLIIRSTIADRFRKLFLCKQPPKFILTVTTHEFLSVRTVSIKPIKANSSFAQNISLDQLSKEVNHIGELLLGLQSLNANSAQDINGQLDSEYKQDFFSLDATSYYMFSRMLVDSNYSLGQKILAVSSKFKSEERVQNCNKDELHWLHEALNQVSDDLLQGFNCSRKELLEILAYCRKSVQQYFHNIHHQHQANLGRKQEYDSQGFPDEIRQLSRIVPETLKQFLHLERVSTSMDIIRGFFVAGLMFKAEVQIKGITEEQSKKAIHLIRNCFSATISQKSRLLKCFGYEQQDFQPYIVKFNFDHEVTF